MVVGRQKKEEFKFKKMKNLIFSCIESRVENKQSLYGCFKLGPFYLNQGLTIATTLRRFLLSDLEGLAVVFLKIEGVKHEYSILKGVQESVLEILSNLKQIQLKTSCVFYKPQIAYLNIQGPKIVSAGDILLPMNVKCAFPSQYIATVASDGQLKIKLFICQGKRYCLQNSLRSIIKQKYKKILSKKTANYLFLDAIFLPIHKVNFTLEENASLKEEFIIFEIWTKGGIHPRQSLFHAINEVIKALLPFRRFHSLQERRIPQLNFQPQKINNSLGRAYIRYKKILEKINSTKFQKKLSSLDISNLNFSVQTYLNLKNANIHTIQNLLEKSKKDLLSFNGFTNQSVYDIEQNLSDLGLNLKD